MLKKLLYPFLSAGGMLLQKLDTTDLQFERMTPFDGAMAYAQNKRQQVVMTDHWANKYKDVHLSTMHPGNNDHRAILVESWGYLTREVMGVCGKPLNTLYSVA